MAIGWPELVLVLFILMLIFGATRVKSLAKALGEGVGEFKKATSQSPEKEDEKKTIIEAAKKMGIETEGKDIKKILQEMDKKV